MKSFRFVPLQELNNIWRAQRAESMGLIFIFSQHVFVTIYFLEKMGEKFSRIDKCRQSLRYFPKRFWIVCCFMSFGKLFVEGIL